MNSLKLLVNSPKAVTATNWLLLLLFLWLVTQFVWSFWPQSTTLPTASVQNSTSAPTFNLNRVLSANLFGAPEKAAEAPRQITAPVTRLNLKLRGVYSSEDDYASAMIEHNRKQEVYRIGAKLPGAAGLTLYRVLPDRIIMSRSGKYETLYVEDFDGVSNVSDRRQPTVISQSPVVRDPVVVDNDEEEAGDDRSVIDKRRDNRVTQAMLGLREKLNEEGPESITQFVNISPVVEEEEFRGFRVSPGQDRLLFTSIGLRRNDIVTEINGIALDDPSASFTIVEQLGTADEITLSVRRGERNVSILISATP
jgi:general secretion pathway protein C